MGDKYTTIAVTRDARARINSATAKAIGSAGRRLSNSEVIVAAMTIAERHLDELLTELEGAQE